MSNFTRKTLNPETGLEEDADWIDDYFGKHIYGVRFHSNTNVVYDVSFKSKTFNIFKEELTVKEGTKIVLRREWNEQDDKKSNTLQGDWSGRRS